MLTSSLLRLTWTLDCRPTCCSWLSWSWCNFLLPTTYHVQPHHKPNQSRNGKAWPRKGANRGDHHQACRSTCSDYLLRSGRSEAAQATSRYWKALRCWDPASFEYHSELREGIVSDVVICVIWRYCTQRCLPVDKYLTTRQCTRA